MTKFINTIKSRCLLVFLTIIICALAPVVLTGCSRQKIKSSVNDIVDEFMDSQENNFDETLLGLPYVYIQTQNDELPVNKVDYVNCSFKITNTEDEMDSFTIDLKDSLEDKDSVGIRLRGNSTMNLDKKPYRIKFDKKQSFFGSEKNKNWVLLADYLDPSDMRNYTAFELAEQFENLDFTPNHHHVILYLNGEYQGLYLLTDHIDEKKGRVNVEDDFDAEIDTDFPFMLEITTDDFGMEGIEGVDWFNIDGFSPIEIKYPDADERGDTDTVYNYIYEYMNAVVTLLKNDNQAVDVSFRTEPVLFNDLVDEDSLIDFLLVNEIMGNWNSDFRSIKICKSKNGKLKFGPVWDFDSAATPFNGWLEGHVYDLSITNEIFTKKSLILKGWLSIDGNRERLYNRFMEKRDCIIKVVDQMFDYYKYIAPAAIADAVYWYGADGALKFKEQFEFLQRFLLARFQLLPELLMQL